MIKRVALYIIIFYVFTFIILVSLVGYNWQKDGKTPKQPINFSHQIHFSKVGLPCTHCHFTVMKSRAAGIPVVQTCMTCHTVIKKDNPEIIKLTEYWEDKKPVPWKRIYKLPIRKYVYFSHKRHVKGGLECVTCHGHVELMPAIKQVPQLEMGWCMSCHRAKNTSTDCATCHK